MFIFICKSTFLFYSKHFELRAFRDELAQYVYFRYPPLDGISYMKISLLGNVNEYVIATVNRYIFRK